MTSRTEIEREDAQLRSLGAAIASEQDERSRTDAIEVARERLFTGSPRRSRWPLLAIPVAAAAAIVLVVWLGRSTPAARDDGFTHVAGPMELRGGDRAFLFVDGSEVRVRSGSRVRVEGTGPAQAALLIFDGGLQAHVVHSARTQWAFTAGPFRVNVIGTRLRIDWAAREGHLTVSVDEGAVMVVGPNVERRVGAGETIELDVEAPPSPAASAPASPDEPPAPVPAHAAHARPAAPRADRPDWHALADAREYRAALDAAEEEGLDRMSADDLLTLADVARRAQRSEVAIETLETVRRRFPTTSQSATAAFVLGRIAIDGHHPDAAAGHFERYLAEAPSGRFAREALGRLMEARHAAGDVSRARTVARDYLARYPDGPHVALARAILE